MANNSAPVIENTLNRRIGLELILYKTIFTNFSATEVLFSNIENIEMTHFKYLNSKSKLLKINYHKSNISLSQTKIILIFNFF